MGFYRSGNNIAEDLACSSEAFNDLGQAFLNRSSWVSEQFFEISAFNFKSAFTDAFLNTYKRITKSGTLATFIMEAYVSSSTCWTGPSLPKTLPRAEAISSCVNNL
jgi:hypothetical protein